MPIKNSDIPSHSSLIIFEAAARLGSLTSAANELCVTPTAVSKQVKQLEAFLNTTLFLRKKNGLELTTKGQSYLTTVNQVLHLLSEESKKLNDDLNPSSINIEVGACFSHFWLIPRLDDFRSKYPDIHLNISINSERNIQPTLSKQHDVAFYYSAKDTPTPRGIKLFNDRLLLVCSPNFLRKNPQCENLDQIWQQPLLALQNAPKFWENWQTWAKHHGIAYQRPINEMRLEDQISIIYAAINGVGIALVWDWHVESLIEAGQLVALSEVVEGDKNAFFLTLSEKEDNFAAKSFMNWVTETTKSVNNHQRVAVSNVRRTSWTN